MPMAKNEHSYTFADYLSWDENERIEIIDGQPITQSVPSRRHQEVSGEIFRQIANYLDGKNCKVYAAPFSVRLPLDCEQDDKITTVVEPDITIICDDKKLDDKGCKGAPDMVVEILSQSSIRHDRLIKFNKYQQAGVQEYWIVDPVTNTVQTFILENGIFKTIDLYTENDIAKVNILDGCFIELNKVFVE